MRQSNKKRIQAFLLALLLSVTCLFGSLQSAGAATKDAGDYYIKINKGTNVVTVYQKDGTPYTAFTCSIGYATPIGTFHTMNKYRWWVLDGPCYGQYCTRITGSILFHSVWYYQQQANTQSYRQYNKLGTTASHGCCRLTVAASKWIYDNCPLGTKVVIFNGTSKDDPLGKPKTITVKGYSGWDPTDPAKDNPYKTGSTKPTIKVSKKTVVYGSKFKDENMSCKDSGGFDITDWVKRTGTVNTKKVGSYPVTYSVIDSFGRTATKKITYKVVDKKAATLTGVKNTLTKKVGDTRNMLVGLKAKDAAGVDLTAKIRVYVKEPGQDSYQKVGKTYTFEQSGTYHVKYIVTNPNNKKQTVKKQTITVKDNGAPTLTSKTDWEPMLLTGTDTEYFWDDLMKGITAELAGGTDVTDEVEILIMAPDGTEVSLFESQSYTFDQIGEYALTYIAVNPEKPSRKTEHMRMLTVTAADDLSGEVTIDE